ncbi:MAG TPA: bifunctional salicylyl-CoA 5-hydroxylase/oxidoreductase [Candidatus Saccharimonadales bacterium]|nr:bifunctional salicylyl-CoA 5-hydroxylase/oxidoreductase [Candidatus Saccharimonadales bacterium]
MKIDVIGGGPAGLYFAALAAKARPDATITVFEKNAPNVTWGWGVVFSDETLENFREADRRSHDAIVATFARWTNIDIHFRGRMIRSGGHAFYGLRRMRLLEILQERCRVLGVRMEFDTEVTDLSAHADADLIVAADGVNSLVRETLAAHFEPDVSMGRSPYIWLATEKLLDSFTFIIEENDDGIFTVHSYPFDYKTSTFIVETDEESWRKAGLDRATEAESVAYCEKLFAPWLDGNGLMSNRSAWLRFRRVRCRTWRDGNVVLIGDAAHTAHFSIGSGTKLAMEDSIALARAISETPSIPKALDAYYEARWLDVAKKQRVAEVSQAWFENIKRYRHFDPEQFAVGLLSRSRKVTHGNLKMRDGAYIASVDRWFADRNGCEGVEPPPPPMFTPFTLRGMELKNRVVVSPMCMYSAEDGVPNDWHLVHLGSRAIGGAGLVITEMTDVSRDGRISPGCTGMYLDEHVPAWRRITDFVHRWSEAKIGMQLAHAGRKGSTKVQWEGDSVPLEKGNWPLIAPSPIRWAEPNQIPREMTRADMEQVRDDFARSAEMAVRAGFDMLELHFAHGYLLASFISPLTNERKDAYGGSLENRMRFPLEIFDAVRAAWPETKPISVRLSGSDWLPGGFDPDQAVEAARILKAHGCDIIDVSSAWTTPDSVPVFQRMYQVPFSDRIRNEAGIPTMTVGEIRDWDMVNTALVSGHADLCVLARPHLYDPYLTLHAAADQEWYGVRWPDQYLRGAPRPPEKRHEED